MSIVLFLVIVGLFVGIAQILPWPETPGLLLAVQLIASVVLLLGPIVVYSAIDAWLDRRAMERIAKAWCMERNLAFRRIERHKKYITVVYTENARTKRARFRFKYIPTTWIVKEVTWL